MKMAYIPGDVILYKYRVEKWLSGDLYQVTQLSRSAQRMLRVYSRSADNVTEEIYRKVNDEFQAAVRLSAQISHPNLLQVFDCDSSAELLTLVMEYAPGGSLAERMAKVTPGTPAVPTGEAIRLAGQIADGLQALHSRGYVHGDLQPANIFLDEQGQVKLGGLGKANQPGYALDLFSTPAAVDSDYASPEQKAGARNLTFASDIYALG
jgi:eukaryotic-like serine/threonine-protein kinase